MARTKEEGLREAMRLLNLAAKRNPHIDPEITPWYCATNLLLVEISEREGVSLQTVVNELKEEADE